SVAVVVAVAVLVGVGVSEGVLVGVGVVVGVAVGVSVGVDVSVGVAVAVGVAVGVVVGVLVDVGGTGGVGVGAVGTSRKAGVAALIVPTSAVPKPMMSALPLIADAEVSAQPALGSMTVFRSVIWPPCQRKASSTSSIVFAEPATCPAALIPCAELEDPPSVPRSVICPFCQRNAWGIFPPESVDAPATVPESLMA